MRAQVHANACGVVLLETITTCIIPVLYLRCYTCDICVRHDAIKPGGFNLPGYSGCMLYWESGLGACRVPRNICLGCCRRLTEGFFEAKKYTEIIVGRGFAHDPMREPEAPPRLLNVFEGAVLRQGQYQKCLSFNYGVC